MRTRPQSSDLLAIAILAILVGVVGTGLGVAATHVRSSGSNQHGPLRMILRPSHGPMVENPSLQRDRVRLRPGR
jgi:hypothetical protein